MGIPKFFRFISERWPMISQSIDGTQIPEFDNLYLDMNSILHTCTRPKDEDVTKRLSEEEVFSNIFAYIDHLFDTIKPQQVFYMAIDGVAPRAKMNQQRARRFRTAVDAEKNLQKAIQEGVEIPKEEPFDSNAITPGTEFMAKLTRYLKYFIHKKVSTDSRWQEVEIILSGHEVPGEGEHKIMEFIRNKKAAKDYNPNLRHCIYGLDADLIILGLVSHDPHFALLREEVVFGRRSTQPKSLEEQKFYLLHLNLVREYLELEFQDLKDQIKFEYNFERILDDFILILYVIGNDFLPNLPDLHLNKGAFPLLLETFKQALRLLDGYINEYGTINLKRLGVWLDLLSKFEQENFEHEDVDLEWFNKQLEHISISGEKKREKIGKLALLKQQRKLVGIIKPWLIKVYSKRLPTVIEDDSIPSIKLPSDLVEPNLDFLKSFAFDTDLILTHSKSTSEYSLRVDIDGIDLHESDQEFEERGNDSRRIVKRYEAAIILDAEGEDAIEEKKTIYNEKFEEWKDNYYKDKLGFSLKDEDKIRELTENYIEGLQWVLYYYYKGVQSWPWYFKYHYSPRISDIKKGLDIIINFDKGTPFKPFEQLMAVLPARSRHLVPAPYRPLMTEDNSPIKDFYPDDVETDLNGKTAEWEAVVKLAFVDPKRLQDALAPLDSKLTAEEKQRNSFGSDIAFTFNPQIEEIYKSPLAGVFSDIEKNLCYETKFHLETVEDSKLVEGLCEGALLGQDVLAGFPTLATIPFTYELKSAGVLIFNQPSRSTSVILSVKDTHEGLLPQQFAERYVGKVVYTGYPYLKESKIVRVSDGENEYFSVKQDKGFKVVSRPIDPEDIKSYKGIVNNNRRYYSTTRGVEIGAIRALVYVKVVNGLKRINTGAFVKDFAKEETVFPLELVVENVKNKDHRYLERPPLPINEEFPIDSKVIFLGDYAYGGQATVNGYSSTARLNLSVLKLSTRTEPAFGTTLAQQERKNLRYFPSYEVARNLKLHPLFLSKIFSSFMLLNEKKQKVNVGLDLKFDSRREKVIGYTRKNEKGWEYSNAAINLINTYKKSFPDFFRQLSTKSFRYGDIPTAGSLWPDVSSKEVETRLKSISDWLKSVKSKLVRASLESDALSAHSVQEIENQIEVFAALPDKQDTKKLIGVPRDAVLDSKVSFNRLKAQTFHLGDRVVYVHDSGKVGIFSKGTVVGYSSIGSSVTLQILFDKPLIGGNKLDGRLRTNRGLEVDSSLVLNVTDRQFIYHSKASAVKKTPKVIKGKSVPSGKPQAISDGKKSLNDAPVKKQESTVNSADGAKAQSNSKNGKTQSRKKGNELLSLLKSGKPEKSDETKTGDTVDDNDEKFEDDDDAQNSNKASTLKNIQASIIHQIHGQPVHQQQQQLPPQGFPPQPFPIPPQGYPVYPGEPFIPQGFVPPPGFIPGVFAHPPPGAIPQGYLPQQSSASIPEGEVSNHQADVKSSEKTGFKKDGKDKPSTRGRGGHRGRGILKRGGGIASTRGPKSEKSSNSKANGETQS